MKTVYRKTILLFILFVISGIHSSMAQEDTTAVYKPYNPREENKVPFGQRLVFGGGLGLQFGDQTMIDIEPVIGYKITPQLIGGIGVKYIYFKTKFYYFNTLYEYSTNIYGGSIFGRYYFIPNIFGHIEYEMLNLEVPDEFHYGNYYRTNISSVLVGGGYSQEIGERASLGIAILYDLIDDPNSPYINPIIRVGFGFGF